MAILCYIVPAWLISFAGTALALSWLRKLSVMDMPNARSNHKTPVPRGGGVAMVVSALLVLACYGVDRHVIMAAALLAVVSLADDIKGLPAHWRLVAQLAAVVLALSGLHIRLFPGFVPEFTEWGIIIVGWVWFINLTNFLDGIDGITSMQTIAVMVGICLLASVEPSLPSWLAASAGIIAAATLGFYWFNRHPARLFMGDVGSVTLGFLTFFLLLGLAAHGAFIPALILPAYYMSDASFTLAKRLLRGEKVWQAHSEHAYQQAVRKGLSHAQVVCRISGLNMLLIVLAVSATHSVITAVLMLIIAYAVTACMIRHLMS